ncbi:hypothetical protein LCGC14_2819190 [marine sediment metagenome]|uniref:Uncharacterized protein n=1 Tax=marine sediment metagenome TaxID=412755 RepID=A0A0F8YHK4_9ZZZZ
MRRICPLLVTLTVLTGCATTNWHAQSENEMRQVIGETVLQAVDQYQAYLRTRGEQDIQDSLKGQDNAKPTH